MRESMSASERANVEKFVWPTTKYVGKLMCNVLHLALQNQPYMLSDILTRTDAVST